MRSSLRDRTRSSRSTRMCGAGPRGVLKGCLNSLPRIDHLIDLAIEEDAGLGDVTSRAIFSAKDRSRGFIDAKQDLVVCGLAVAARVFERVDPALEVEEIGRASCRERE